MKYAIALAVALSLNAAANLLMKTGVIGRKGSGDLLQDGVVGAIKSVMTSPVLLVGLACFILNAGFYMYALQSEKLKISIAYPVMVGGGYAIIATLAYLLLQERMTVGQWLGVLIILAGVIVVAAQTGEGPAVLPPGAIES